MNDATIYPSSTSRSLSSISLFYRQCWCMQKKTISYYTRHAVTKFMLIFTGKPYVLTLSITIKQAWPLTSLTVATLKRKGIRKFLHVCSKHYLFFKLPSCKVPKKSVDKVSNKRCLWQVTWSNALIVLRVQTLMQTELSQILIKSFLTFFIALQRNLTKTKRWKFEMKWKVGKRVRIVMGMDRTARPWRQERY